MALKQYNNNGKNGTIDYSQTFYHGTKANLNIGDLIEVGFNSNYGKKKKAKYNYLTATLDAAIWGAELALGEGRDRTSVNNLLCRFFHCCYTVLMPFVIY